MYNLSLDKRALLKLIECIDLNKKILEVRPLQTPLFSKNDANVFYADIYSAEEIKERFSMNDVVPIDYVIKEGYEKTFKEENIKFDYILLNNVLEHIPNPIDVLLDMSKILNKNGKIGLLLPDREFSIDYYRENSSFTEWYDVYIRGERNNTPRLALDFKLNHINNRNGRDYWKKEIEEVPSPDINYCLRQYSDLIYNFDEHNFDEHYWAFTDRSFLRIIVNFLKLNIFPFRLENFYPTAFNDNVFGVLLEFDESILENEGLRNKSIDEIRNVINIINKLHFQIDASELIREKNRLEELLKCYVDTEVVKQSHITFFNNLHKFKKTVKGLNDYLFLVNDGNSELRQHFDPNYVSSNFNPNSFIYYFNIKNNLFKMKNIDSYYFIVPDKSVVCKKFLPFDYSTFFRRNYDFFKGLFPDFVNDLDYNDYFRLDTHMNSYGGRKLVFRILNYINSSFTINQFNEILNEYNYFDKPIFDLVSDINWSYSDDDLKKYDSTKYSQISHPLLNNISDSIPLEFKSSSGGRLSYHYQNDNALFNKKVLFFHDSSIESLQNFLIPFFRESFFYWDHLNLNKELIQWYNPDMIIEIRIERFLENYNYPDWIKNNESL